MRYEIEFSRAAKKELEKFPRNIQKRIAPHIDALMVTPYPPGCKRLKGYPGWFRIRVGQYRIVYEVGGKVKIVLIIRIAHRRTVYRTL